MKIKIQSNEAYEELTKELLFTLASLRYWTDKWSEHYGYYYLRKKTEFEKRADNILEKLNMEKPFKKSQIEIIHQPEQTT